MDKVKMDINQRYYMNGLIIKCINHAEQACDLIITKDKSLNPENNINLSFINSVTITDYDIYVEMTLEGPYMAQCQTIALSA